MKPNFEENCSFIAELTLEIFKCDICNDLLKPPVKMIKEVGIVCRECAKNKKQFTSIPRLDAMINNLLIPCQFASVGCEEKIPYSNLNDHEKICDYAPCGCIKEECTWEGVKQWFPKHFTEVHNIDVIDKIDDQLTFKLDLEKAQCKILKFCDSGYFLMYELMDDFLSYSMFRINNDGESTAILRLLGEAKTIMEIRMNCDILPLSSLLDDKDNYKPAIVNVTGIRTFLDGHDITLVVEVPRTKVYSTLPGILERLDCPICKRKMKMPIFKCKLGHSICIYCLSNVSICPYCKNTYKVKGKSALRNFGLEALTLNVYYPCVYQNQGCGELYNGYSLSLHEAACNYKYFSCPMDEFKGGLDKFKDHIMTTHEDMVIEDSKFVRQIRKNTPFSDAYFLCFQGSIFHIYFHCWQFETESPLVYFCEVTVVMNNDELKCYSCKVGITNSKKTLKLKETKFVTNSLQEEKRWEFSENFLTDYGEERFISVGFKEFFCTDI